MHGGQREPARFEDPRAPNNQQRFTLCDRLYVAIVNPGRLAWLALMRSGGQLGHGSFGARASRAREALRRGARWITDTTACLYADDLPAEPATA